MAVQLLLLFSPLLVCCSTQTIRGYEEHWWSHPLEKFGFGPSPYSQHPWTSPQVTSEDSKRFTLKKFRLAKRFDEAQVQEALASDDETGRRWKEEAERHLLHARLKRTKMEHLSGAGKEYVTRLGKRSWMFHRWANGWRPLKTFKRSHWALVCVDKSCGSTPDGGGH